MGNSLQCSQIYRFHIFLNCEDGDYGCFFFFFAKTSTLQGLYNCKLKNEMTLMLDFFFAKKNNNKQTNKQSWQDGLSHLLSSLLA